MTIQAHVQVFRHSDIKTEAYGIVTFVPDNEQKSYKMCFSLGPNDVAIHGDEYLRLKCDYDPTYVAAIIKLVIAECNIEIQRRVTEAKVCSFLHNNLVKGAIKLPFYGQKSGT